MNPKGSLTTPVVGGASVAVLGPCPGRQHLTFSPPGTGRVTFSTNNPAVLDAGITVSAGNPPFRACGHDIGDLIERPWYAIADAAGRQVGIVEGMKDGA